MSRYLVGIDLGTTNSALAYIDLEHPTKSRRSMIQTFMIPQLVALGETAARELLPSFLYIPGAHDLPAGAAALPWDPDAQDVVGEFARNFGGRLSGRLVTSAKSWLCHSGVDRSAPLLPWNAPHDVPRRSPVEVSCRYLCHLAQAWNYSMARDRHHSRLEEQAIVLTVPASFDDMARRLTIEAARNAGFQEVVLLEEPQAAFYCWLATHPAREIAALKPGSVCLVIDVGGGTSDFSLIQAVEKQGALGFVRLAVGDHLLLGGDNMDLALARLVESRLASHRLDAGQFGSLVQACRQAKEALLSPNPTPDCTVSVIGRGRQVVGGTLHSKLTATDVRAAIFEGFFPHVSSQAKTTGIARTGLHEMGLPYVNNPAISHHLLSFMRTHLSRDNEMRCPQAILFNGGVFQPAALRQRVIDVMSPWLKSGNVPVRPIVLTNSSLDLAVAWGAAHYAWLRETGGRRIGGGIARSYYVAIETPEKGRLEPAQSDSPKLVTVLCVVPQKLEEGEEVVLSGPDLELALGQPVTFPLLTSTIRFDDRPGEVLKVQPDQLLRLPPLHTILRGGKRSGTKRVPVKLAARCTAIGTLELWCVAIEGDNRWRLEFNVRDIVKPAEDRQSPSDDEQIGVRDVWPEAQVQEAAKLIRECYLTDQPPVSPRDLTRALEKILETRRQEWPTGLCRRLWDFLAEISETRRRSPGHLARWYYLAGYSLRPGFGDVLDTFRVDQLWKMLHAPPRPATQAAGRATIAIKSVEGGADYWIMWRRVAGGLSTTLQEALFERIRPLILLNKSKGSAKPGANELAEAWRAAASLERLEPKLKELLGQALIRQLRKRPTPTYGFWALSRLGARVLFYGPMNSILHPAIVQAWLDSLMTFEAGHESERMAWAFCLVQLARRSGLRAFDVDDAHHQQVLGTLRLVSVPGDWIEMLERHTLLNREQQSQIFGESLPIGLRLSSVGD
jgi:hypothetical protein